ncbi:MAG: Transport energizing protein TolR [candidate division TM6 bacterium GW2011_GWE2_41_16]|nr:MAG: Transport energizing protein TolR [candidate division TM6 bacterium GW2011_GWE2_41_16]
MMGRRFGLQRKYTQPEVSLTPLIDTLLVLLIVFMVATPLVHNALHIELPSGSVQEVQSAHEDVVIYWDKQNKIFLNGVMVSMDTIIDKVKGRVKVQPDMAIFVQADRQVAYGDIVEFIDMLKARAGVRYVALETRATPHKASVAA